MESLSRGEHYVRIRASMEKLCSNVIMGAPIGLNHIHIYYDVAKIKPVKETLLLYKHFYDFDTFHSIWHKNLPFCMYNDKYRIEFKDLQNRVRYVTDGTIHLTINDVLPTNSKDNLSPNNCSDDDDKHPFVFDSKFWFASDRNDYFEELYHKFGINCHDNTNINTNTIDTLKFISFKDLVSIFGEELIKDYILRDYKLKVKNKQYQKPTYGMKLIYSKANGMICGEIEEKHHKYHRFTNRRIQISNINVADESSYDTNCSMDDRSGGKMKKLEKDKREALLSKIKHKCDCEDNDDGKCIHSFRLYLEYIKKFY